MMQQRAVTLHVTHRANVIKLGVARPSRTYWRKVGLRPANRDPGLTMQGEFQPGYVDSVHGKA